MEKRIYKRMAVPSAQVNASVGKKVFQGRVTDVSRFGFAACDFTPMLKEGSRTMKVVLDVGQKKFKMDVVVCWDHVYGSHQSMGAQIKSSSAEWLMYVASLENKSWA
ncbi:MAG: hypothetical protein CSA32_05115 [Desulfobulbus propionicus]|nr:MAG: hypothetical protein CSA32_05115 [Desulfobulbus propionicus]